MTTFALALLVVFGAGLVLSQVPCYLRNKRASHVLNDIPLRVGGGFRSGYSDEEKVA